MKIAVITGASSGMGKEFVLQIGREEQFDEIWAIARSRERLEALKAECTIPIRPVSLDLTAPDAMEIYAAMLREHQPEVSLLVNASGFGKFAPIEEVGAQESANMIDLNCRALTVLTELTLPYMKKGSRIAQIASVAAYQPVPYIATYAATKAFVLSYTRSLGVEMEQRGIRVMAVCPYWTDSSFFDRAQPKEKRYITNFTVMLDPADVVKQAIRDLYHTKKPVSIFHWKVKLQVLGVKLLPHTWVMKIFLRQQGIK
ncbi:MAG: SDR family NAD(P)-dependent oxidoreductase [Oscillospiraceae bacterium]|nr:SDR family NAD(P)-dependent oxidoreductase [Oscillospiraceae bacterium]